MNFDNNIIEHKIRLIFLQLCNLYLDGIITFIVFLYLPLVYLKYENILVYL
jgi:hypothetical protein